MLNEINRNRQILYDLNYIWNLRIKQNSKLREKGDHICGYQTQGQRERELDKDGQKHKLSVIKYINTRDKII